MSEGCMFCRDAGLDFDWCRVCGRGAPEEPSPEPSKSELREVVDKARRIDPVEFINAYNEARRRAR